MVKGGLGVAIIAFIAVVIGAAFMTSLANNVTSITQANTVINESTAFVNGSSVALDNSQLDSLTSITNGTAVLRETTDYTVDLAKGVIAFSTLNTTLADTNYDVTYVYRDVGNSTARNLIVLVILLFAIGVFTTVLYFLSPQLRELIDGMM